MRAKFIHTCAVALGVAAAACTTRATAPESTLTGTVALTTFSATPSAVAARDESGRVARAPVDVQGRFVLPLPKAHTYRLSVEVTDQSIPVVFPRPSGSLDATFVLETNGASIALGRVRYHASAPAGGFQVLSAAAPSTPSTPSTDCTDCVGDDPQVTCDDSEASERSTEGADVAEQADPNAELATADQNVPAQVDGCDNEDGDNVDQEQEGEH